MKIYKLLLIFITLDYVYTKPTEYKTLYEPERGTEPPREINIDVLKDEKFFPFANYGSKQKSSKSINEEKTISETSTLEKNSEQKLNRVVRNNKIEYVYLNSEGEIIPSEKVYAKNVVEKSSSLKDVLSKRNAESIDEISKSDDKSSTNLEPLHYSSSGIKVRSENLKRSNGLPSTVPGFLQASPTISTTVIPSTSISQQIVPQVSSTIPSPLISPQIAQSVNPLDISLINSYLSSTNLNPLLMSSTNYNSLYNQLLGGALLTNLLGSSTNLSPETLLSQSGSDLLPSLLLNLPYLYQNRLTAPYSTSSYLFSRTLNTLLNSPNLMYNTPYVNPLLHFMMPLQTPNLNYLMGRSVSLNDNLANPVLSNLVNNLLYSGVIQNISPNSHPQTTSHTTQSLLYQLLPQYLWSQSIWPQPLMPQPLMPQPLMPHPLMPQPLMPQPLLPPPLLPQPLLPPPLMSQPMSTQAILPQIGSRIENLAGPNPINVLPFSDSNAQSSVTSGNIEQSETDKSNNIEKPLLYSNHNSNHNAALSRSFNPVYSNLNIYPNHRITDPALGLNYLRYPYSYVYPAYPYSPAALRPGLISYPNLIQSPTGYGYNGIGFYSAGLQDSPILGKKIENSEDSKLVPSKEQLTNKDGNLMYSIKTSKTESKETLSRLNQNLDANKIIREDDKKA